MNQIDTLKFASVGSDVMIYPGARIVNPEVISLGNSIIIDDFVFFMGGTKAQLGDFIHIAAHSSIVGGGEFYMGSFSGLSGGIRVYTGNDNYLGESLTNPTIPAPYRIPIRSFVKIGKHVIIGANSVILPGVTLHDGVAVGANSLVNQDCEPWTIYVGSPAKPLRARPHARILELEAQLMADLYDSDGQYRPEAIRS